MEKSLQVENLQTASVNLVLTQIRSKWGSWRLDETFAPVLKSMNFCCELEYFTPIAWGEGDTGGTLVLIPLKCAGINVDMRMSAERRGHPF